MNMDEKKKKCENEEEEDVSEALLPITCACTVGSCQVLFVNLTSPQPLSSLFIHLFICLSWFDRSSRLERWRSSNEWNQRFRSSPCRIKTGVHLFVLLSPIGALYAIVVQYRAQGDMGCQDLIQSWSCALAVHRLVQYRVEMPQTNF